MRISARNVIEGTVVSVKKGDINAQVKVDIGGGHVITSVITVDSTEELGLKAGEMVSVIIKASSVMLGR